MRTPKALQPLKEKIERIVKKQREVERLEDVLGKELQPLYDKFKYTSSIDNEMACHDIASFLSKNKIFLARFFYQMSYEIAERRKKKEKNGRK